MQQEGNVVTPGIEVATIDIDHVGQGVQVFNRRAVGIVGEAAIIAVRNSKNLGKRFSVCELDRGEVELAAGDKINRRTIFERLLWTHSDMRPDKRNFYIWIRVFNSLRQLAISFEARSAGKQRQKFVILRDFNGLMRRNVVLSGIQ